MSIGVVVVVLDGRNQKMNQQKPPKLTLKIITRQIELFGVFCYAPKLWSDRNDTVFKEAEKVFIHPDVVMNKHYLLVERGKDRYKES